MKKRETKKLVLGKETIRIIELMGGQARGGIHDGPSIFESDYKECYTEMTPCDAGRK